MLLYLDVVILFMVKEEFVYHIRRIGEFLRAMDNHRAAIYEWSKDKNIREMWVQKNVPIKHREFVHSLLEKLAEHPELRKSYGWLDKAIIYHDTGKYGRDYLISVEESIKRWQDVVAIVSKIAEVSKDPNVRSVAEELERKLNEARESVEYLRGRPKLVNEYLSEMAEQAERMRRARKSLDDIPEI